MGAHGTMASDGERDEAERHWDLGNHSGLLPHARGPLARAWQRTLDADLRARAQEFF